MKLKTRYISLAGLLIIALIGGVVVLFPGDQAAALDVSEWENLSASEIESAITPLLSRDELSPEQVVAALTWLFLNQPDLGDTLLGKYAFSVSGMPTRIGDAAWQLIQNGEATASMRLLSTGRELFPNSPRVLSMLGIVNIFADRPIEARQFLEEAYRWDAEDLLTNYYLGGLLIQSTSISDRARGKTAMWKVLRSADPRLSELAALLLLTNEDVPLIQTEFLEILDVLEERDALRPENENLSADALRFILNRLVRVFPEEALPIGEVLVDFPGSSLDDRLGVVELAQNEGQADMSGEFLDTINADEIPADSELALRYERARAIQAIATDQVDGGVDRLLGQIEKGVEPDLLRQAIERALRFDISLEAEVALLRGFLQLPVENPLISLRVLRRLSSIAPLRESDFHQYAIDNLLPFAPTEVSQWLASRGRAALAVEALDALNENGMETQLARVESFLAMDDTASAQTALTASWSLFSPALAHYLQARIHFQNNNLEEAVNHWIEARDAAAVGSDFQLLRNLGFLALELEQPMNALQSIYTAFTSGIPLNEGEVLSLLELVIEYGTLAQAMVVCEHLASAYPDRAVYQNNLCYFNFLAEESVEESVEVMRDLVEDYPDINQYKLTLAFGLLKAGRTNEASRLIQSSPIDWDEAGTRGQLVYAAVLAASDQRLAAEGLIQNLDTDSLLPEERALLESF